MDIEVDVTVDVSGLRCPDPLSVVRNKIRDMEVGQILYVIATDRATTWDLPNYCRFLKHEMVHKEAEDKPYLYWIRKSENGR